MRVSQPKLKKDQLEQFRQVPVNSFSAYTLMASPVYVYLRKNEKLVAVKAPLGFFSEPELQKYSKFEHFYVPVNLERLAPFQTAGAALRRLNHLREQMHLKTRAGESEPHLLPIGAVEKTEAVLEILRPLWRNGMKFDVFGPAVTLQEVCGQLLEESRLVEESDHDLDRFERQILRADVASFLGLHLGYHDPDSLCAIRELAFADPDPLPPTEMGDLVQLTKWLVRNTELETIDLSVMRQWQGRTARKILAVIGGLR